MLTPPLPSAFIDRCIALFGAEQSAALTASLDETPPVSIRYNPYKITQPPLGKHVPWCRYGYYLPERPSFTLDPAFHAGAYYVQEASSMFIETLFRSVFEQDTPLSILDLCAAPGGKTTLLSTLAGTSSVIVANEVIRTRALTLAENVRRWGIGNVVVTNNDPAHFTALRHRFDLVVVDTPCSGEGMFRKTPEARTQWSENNVSLCEARSRRILSQVWESLRPGGVMIYSTCTFNSEENEETIRWLASEYACERVDVAVDSIWGVLCGEAGGMQTFRFLPHRVAGEGFFCCVLRKSEGKSRCNRIKLQKNRLTPLSKQETTAVGGWLSHPEAMRFARVGEAIYGYHAGTLESVKEFSEQLSVVSSGVLCGELFNGKLRPAHALSLFCDLNRERVSSVELPRAVCLDYLRKKEIPATPFSEGINLICCEGLPLGWIKRIGARSNNMLPKELRILNL